MKLCRMSESQLKNLKVELTRRYNEYKSRGLDLNMARGKPAPVQLDLSNDMVLSPVDYKSYIEKTGIDCRNYGGFDGLEEMKELFGQLLEVPASNVIIGGNSSLNMMFDCISQAMSVGFGFGPWAREEKIKFLCPAPGYDRHFAVTQYFGFELITVKMNNDGPDMDAVEEYVKDPCVKGIWCVPKYSNPTGITYSDDVVKRFASLNPAAKDFKIFWDNSYVIHNLTDTPDKLLNIFELCRQNSKEDMLLEFTSTSKVSFPGSGIAGMAASDNNIALLKKRINFQTIGPDKLNQLRHLNYFVDYDNIIKHMAKHAEIIRPKFDVVLKTLEKELTPYGIGSWTKPNGGYFVSVDLPEGCATRTYELCKEAGVVLTKAGATFPYGKDPKDSNIRIAPTYPPVEELELAIEIFCISAMLAAIEKIK